MSKLERKTISQGWCSLSEYYQLKRLSIIDKIILKIRSIWATGDSQ